MVQAWGALRQELLTHKLNSESLSVTEADGHIFLDSGDLNPKPCAWPILLTDSGLAYFPLDS